MLMLCPICAGEFEFSAADCPACGCNLVASTLQDDLPRNRATENVFEFVEMCRSRGYPVAMLIKQTLEQNGVTVILQGGNFISVMPNLAFGGELRVLVPSHQLEYARALYEAYFEGGGECDFASDE
jgi:ABC-type transport system substrate-binding protein